MDHEQNYDDYHSLSQMSNHRDFKNYYTGFIA